ncbi:hypothetical protein ACOME3_005852 [Neoechinorhynchus agilis]
MNPLTIAVASSNEVWTWTEKAKKPNSFTKIDAGYTIEQLSFSSHQTVQLLMLLNSKKKKSEVRIYEGIHEHCSYLTIECTGWAIGASFMTSIGCILIAEIMDDSASDELTNQRSTLFRVFDARKCENVGIGKMIVSIIDATRRYLLFNEAEEDCKIVVDKASGNVWTIECLLSEYKRLLIEKRKQQVSDEIDADLKDASREKALLACLRLGRRRQALNIVKEMIADQETGQFDRIIQELVFNPELKSECGKLVEFVADWNTLASQSAYAQEVLIRILATGKAGQLLVEPLSEKLLAYNERHSARIKKLYEKMHILDCLFPDQ